MKQQTFYFNSILVYQRLALGFLLLLLKVFSHLMIMWLVVCGGLWLIRENSRLLGFVVVMCYHDRFIIQSSPRRTPEVYRYQQIKTLQKSSKAIIINFHRRQAAAPLLIEKKLFNNKHYHRLYRQLRQSLKEIRKKQAFGQ